MNAEAAMLEDFQEWRRLAETEGEAIRRGDWKLLADCQNGLRELQGRILVHTAGARKEWAGQTLDCSDRENKLRQIVSGLEALELRNQGQLESRLKVAALKREELS